MKLIFGLALFFMSAKLSRLQCVLEKEYFCSSIPNDFPEGLTSVLFVVTNLGVINATIFNSPSLGSVSSLALANSGITRIEPGAFHIFRSLTKLGLYQNSLTEVMGTWLTNPGRLENLTVAQNLIAEIGPNTFSGFFNLTTLNLANNQIHRISGGSFRDLIKLTWIDLSGNNLTTLTRNVLSRQMPPAMKLGGNPWNCSCELQDFGLFLQELINASLLMDAASVVCHNPPSLKGVHVWNISNFSCPTDFVSSVFQYGFHEVGLPALLASSVLISLILLLLLIWMMKRDKQIQPSKVVHGPLTSSQDSTRDHRGSGEADRATTTDKSLQSRMLKVRAKSAAAILLQTEFQQGLQTESLAATNQEHLTKLPSVSLKEQHDVGREDLWNLMEPWCYHQLQEQTEGHRVNPFSADVHTETPAIKTFPITTQQILPDKETSETPGHDNGKDCRSAEDLEPFLYLSVATETEELMDINPQKDMVTIGLGSHLGSLKRALTWPPDRICLETRSDSFSIRESFMAQFFLPAYNLGEPEDSGRSELGKEQIHVKPREAHQINGGSLEPNREEKLVKETTTPHKRESTVAPAGESVVLGKSEPKEELQRCYDLQGYAPKACQMYDTITELHMNEKATLQPELPLQKESKVPGATRLVHHTSQSKSKAVKCPASIKNKPASKPASSRSAVHQASHHPSPPLSDDAGPTRSPCENVFLENKDYNYINLLHEIVENRGRWTRERWKQTHRIHVTSQPQTKSE